MASRASRIAAAAREIFGTLPNRNARSGAQILKKPLVGAYHARWYMEPIEPAARAVSPSRFKSWWFVNVGGIVCVCHEQCVDIANENY